MSEWRQRRFWTRAEIAQAGGAFLVLLDDRPIHTPARARLELPTEALARAVVGEWEAQGEVVAPQTMPVTRSANSAIDKVRPQRAEVEAHLASYAETDLICHRAEGPEALALAEAEAWDPLLDWARSGLGAPLAATAGIVPVAQPPRSLERLAARLAAEDDFALTALADLVGLSGSLVIGLAVLDEVLPAQELWRRSRIDESWQESQWGIDEQAVVAAAAKRADFLHATRFAELSRRVA